MMRRVKGFRTTVQAEYESDTISVTFDVSAVLSDFYPAQLCGPPERCYPAEGGETEFTEVRLVAVKFMSRDGNRVLAYLDYWPMSESIMKVWPDANVQGITSLPDHRRSEIKKIILNHIETDQSFRDGLIGQIVDSRD